MGSFLLVVLLGTAPALPLPASVDRMLDRGDWDGVPRGLRVISLSLVADGCVYAAEAHPALHAQAERCVDRAMKRAAPLVKRNRGDGLALTHWALILGDRDRLGPCADPAGHARVVHQLRALSLDDPWRHAPSYAAFPERWPADQSATLAALGRYDRAHGAHTLETPLREWRELLLARGLHPRLQLPRSDVTGHGPGARWPRGCAQSYMTRYLAEVDPPLAHRFWERSVRTFRVERLGFTGFREWPPGVERAADADSGPIVLGIGAAASAFAVSAARSQGDEPLARALEASEARVLALGIGGAAAHSPLADAVRFEAQWQPR